MVIIKFIESQENDRYIISSNSSKLGRKYDDNAEKIQVIFPNSEIDSKCTMIVKDDKNNGVDLIEFKNNEIKGVRNNLSKHDKVIIGFVFTTENYIKYTSFKTFFFEPSLYPDNFIVSKPEYQGYYLEAISSFITKIRQNGDNLEFLNLYNEVLGSVNIETSNGISNETDPTVPSYVKRIKQEDINNWNNKIDNTVDNLFNYYLKKDTYSKDEVNQLIGAIRSLKKEIVSELPTTNIDENTIYLVPKTSGSGNDYYDEYLYINGSFEFIGSTQVNLTDYAKVEALDNKVDKFVSESSYEYAYMIIPKSQTPVHRVVNYSALAQAIPIRSGSTLNFEVGTPTKEKECANKEYVDGIAATIPTITATKLEDGSYSLSITTSTEE